MPIRDVSSYRTAVFDSETDPFLADRFPKPFACGFMTGDHYKQTWGENCIADMMTHMASWKEPLLIFVHNGGRFDFHFLFDHVSEPVFIINSRLVEFCQETPGGRHIWRDSVVILPMALAQYQKETIDYRIMEADKRDLPRNRKTIEKYLESDCSNLLALVSRFRFEFEDLDAKPKLHMPITIGQTAMRKMRELHPFARATAATDAAMRPYYHGGRVQCFQGGIVPGPWQVYDVNSSYLAAMKFYDHPLTDDWEEVDLPRQTVGKRWKIPAAWGKVWFADITARNRNALPMKTDTGTRFDVPLGRFHACSHELILALRYGLVDVLEWHSIQVPIEVGRFGDFVDFFTERKIAAELAGDKGGRLIWKIAGNAGYGKFGQDPTKYQTWEILRHPAGDKRLRRLGFEPQLLVNHDPENWIELWAAPAPVQSAAYYNVGIGASITSASRAILLEGLQQAVDPVYCDTDSIICKSFSGEIHHNKLGAWKSELEENADFVAIGGRKTYALYKGKGRKSSDYLKMASKGGDLSGMEILRLCKGGEIEQTSSVPLFSVKSEPRFLTRKFRMTVDSDGKPIVAS